MAGHDYSPLTPTSTEMKRENDAKDDDNDKTEERPLCSVLNTVVDYVMRPPTALEPLDFYQNQPPTQTQLQQPYQTRRDSTASSKNAKTLVPQQFVPVLRIFGPIVRRQDLETNYPPAQSSCLHIHGAFPYLLARPCVAGPDGSLHQKKVAKEEAEESSCCHLDWDDPEAVERFLPYLQELLEEGIALLSRPQNETNATDTAKGVVDKTLGTTRIIRRLSVVMGRGFYSYCPGPPAPFVRVEYYDPANRWKVKHTLEKGLDSLPPFYHPDPFQYDPFGRQSSDNTPFEHNNDLEEEDVDLPELLMFHCYEAHIPYTMQFFKDYNLAGMSYIHAQQAFFRLPLPKGLRNECDVELTRVPRDHLFLQDNVPEEWMWTSHEPVLKEDFEREGSNFEIQEDEEDQGGGASPTTQLHPRSPACHIPLQQPDEFFSQASSVSEVEDTRHEIITQRPKHKAPEKETTCDVELDIHVQDILNVNEVMTDVSEDKAQRDKVHWRAVPSLREIWKQERLRMSKLLPPANVFLSGNTQSEPFSAFTLSVKGEKTATPGARLAVEGMSRLLNVTEGLENDYRRAMKQIVDRYAERIEKVDEKLKGETKRSYASPSKRTDQMVLTPTYDETMQALCALDGTPISSTSGGKGRDVEEIEETSPASPPFFNSQLSGSDGEEMLFFSQQSAEDEREAKKAAKFRQSCESYYDPSRRKSSQSEHVDEGLLSQLVDQGESIVDGPFRHVEDFIDPETLRPYELIDDGDSAADEESENDQLTQENDLERELSLMATQTLGLDNDDPESESEIAFGQEEDTEMSFNYTSPFPSSEVLTDPVSVANREEVLTDPIEPTVDQPNEERKMPATQIGCRKVPPARKEMTDSAAATGLLPMPPKKQTPTWMEHLSAFSVLRKERTSRNAGHSDNWYSVKESIDGHVGLTRRPPSRRNVTSWFRKKTRKRSRQKEERQDWKCKKKQIKASSSVKNATNNLVIDGNSRKLVAMKSDGADLDTGIQGKQVEEVEWHFSQSMSPPDCTQTPAKQIDQSNKSTFELADEDINFSEQQGTPVDLSSSISGATPNSKTNSGEALDGIGNQGGKIWVAGGGRLKAKTRPSQNAQDYQQGEHISGYLSTPLTVMSIEVHIQCRKGRAGINDSKQISMVPDSEKDRVSAVVYVVAKDPGGGEALRFIERGCIFTPLGKELASINELSNRSKLADNLKRALPSQTMGVSAPLVVECVKDERTLLFRIAGKVMTRDPDMLLSWDTQSVGLGYLIERGEVLSRPARGESGPITKIDMVKLMSRTKSTSDLNHSKAEPDPFSNSFEKDGASTADGINNSKDWKGSGMGQEWDDRVGAGAAAASISGRLTLAAWKIVSEEVKHANSSYQPAIVSAVLGCRIPFHDDTRLTEWYGHESGRERWRVVHHRLLQATASLVLFDALDIIGRAGEAARLSGVEFHQSFPGIRGSQYKVEGVLLRALQSLSAEERGSKRGRKSKRAVGSGSVVESASLSDSTKSQSQSPWKQRRKKFVNEDKTKPCHDLNDRAYFFYSPSLRDTDRQEALEVQALTLEPESGHYEDPIVVCDFTALYPSLVIAYNLCYSTCSGRLEYHSTRQEMRIEGRTTGKLGPFVYPEGRTATILKHHMKSLDESGLEKDRMYVAPTGTMYMAESCVKGVLPQVLDEMLSTRAMLKKAAKEYKRLVPDLSPSILRQLEARQLALKYVANVTYGYTSATFSGRCAMPLLADSIVECGRRTLKNAINLANRWGADPTNKWSGCKVLYGDTDSVFVRLPGRSVREAFRFGQEFCDTVTASNPPPVQLKLEKVYFGSILQTKKKYCGMKFESAKESKPAFEAKGIETIRKDQCALTQKILRNSLITLFSKDVAAVKRYLFRQWKLILSGELPISDFILTGRVRSKYRGSGIGPVQAVLARRLAEADPGRVMRDKQRIAFVIVATPGRNFRLRDGVLTPNELLEQWDAFVLNTTYYITKHVNPALQRCLGLSPHKIDVTSWYNEMPKPRRRTHFWPTTITGSTGTISRFFANSICLLCGGKGTIQGQSKVAVCNECKRDDLSALITAFRRLNAVQKEALELSNTCARCNLGFEDSSTYGMVRAAKKSKKKKTSWFQASDAPGVHTPLANCSCTDCPLSFKRHKMRESEEIELELCKTLCGDSDW